MSGDLTGLCLYMICLCALYERESYGKKLLNSYEQNAVRQTDRMRKHRQADWIKESRRQRERIKKWVVAKKWDGYNVQKK